MDMRCIEAYGFTISVIFRSWKDLNCASIVDSVPKIAETPFGVTPTSEPLISAISSPMRLKLRLDYFKDPYEAVKHCYWNRELFIAP